MKLSEFIDSGNISLAAEVEYRLHANGTRWLKLIDSIIPDAITSTVTPVALLSRAAMFPEHINKNEINFYSPCDSISCKKGKYILRNGEESTCFRCQGQGYITTAKHVTNAIWGLSPTGQLKIENGETIPFE